jgi:hypothetical protein
MSVQTIALASGVLLFLNGCYFNTATYQMFVIKRNFYLASNNNQLIPKQYIHLRKIYNEKKCIYELKGDDPRCIYGYLTNKDERPEEVIDWIILSGKKYCKEKPGVGTWM